MPATLVQETFDRGLVTVRDATLLSEGELQQADDCVYRPFDPAIYSAPGRTEYNASALGSPSAVKGLAWLSSDRSSDQLLAYVDTDLYLSPFTSVTGAWTKLLSVGSLSNVGTEQMSLVKYDNSYFFMNGLDRLRRIYFVTPGQVQLVNYTIAGDGFTITTAATGGFKNVTIGQYVTGNGIVANARVATIDTSTYTTITLTPAGSTPGAHGADTLTFNNTTYTDARISGMDPVPAMDTTPVTAAGNTWPTVGDYGGNGYYWFFYTEMYKPGITDDINSGFIESAFIGKPLVVNISDVTAMGVTVTRNTNLTNNGATNVPRATHWQIYMSPRQQDNSTTPTFLRFIRMGSPIEVAQPSVTLSSNAVYSEFKYPTTYAAVGALTQFSNIANVGAVGGGYATAPGANTFNYLKTFGLNALSGTVTGIQLEVSAAPLAALGGSAGGFGISFMITTVGGKISQKYTIESRQSGFKVFTLGGPTSLWNPSSTWAVGDFADGALQVYMDCYWNGVLIDYVKLKVFTGTSLVDANGITARTVTYRSEVGITVTDMAALPPPTASTGAVFQGQLVLNDTTDPATIRFSMPGFPEYFPKPYFLRFDTPKKDIVTNIQRVGQLLVVGLQDTVKRVNYLPTENDTAIDQGLAHEDLASDHGIVGPRAATLFEMANSGVMLAYISYKGIHVTDGITTRFLNTDLDWPNTLNATYANRCILINYSTANWIVLFYSPSGTTHGKNTRALIFSYDPAHIKDNGVLPAIGPIKVSARSACAATLAGVSKMLTGHQSLGKVYVEDNGLTLPAGYTVADSSGSEAAISISPDIITRRFYPGGVNRVARENKVYLQHTACGSTFTVASCPLVTMTTTVSNTGAFGSVLKGMYVTGTGVKPGTIVVTAGTDSITLSQTPLAAGTVTLTFSSGTLAFTSRGQNIGEVIQTMETAYMPLHVGGLVVSHIDNARQAMELRFTRVLMPDTSLASLSPQMRLHYFAYLLSDGGQETNRAAY